MSLEVITKRVRRTVMQMLHELMRKFVKLLIVVFVIMECTLMLHSEKSLNDASFSTSITARSSSKIGNVQKRNLQYATQTFSLGNNRDSENEENMRETKNFKRDKKGTLKRQGPKIWDQWGKWSDCSVTCGVGKLTRWRHCISGGCLSGEKKAQLRTCTLAAC